MTGSGPMLAVSVDQRRRAAAAPSDAEAARFLLQAGLVATAADITRVKTLGYGGWIDEQMAMAFSQSRWDWLVAQGYNDPTRFRQIQAGLDNMIWRKLIASPDHLRQRIVLALSEIFVISPAGLPVGWRQFICAAYLDLLEANCFGTFRALLEAVTLSCGMGVYLNMRGNQKEDPATGRLPDENYAREVLQLFSIGLQELNADGTPRRNASGQPIETYDQSTVTGLARVFTGWDFATTGPLLSAAPDRMRLPMTFFPSRHSTATKTFLGVTVAAGTDGRSALRVALDTIANHRNVGPFISRQLIQRLVTSNPSPAYVARIAAVFDNNGRGVRGDLKAVIRALLLDPEARSVPTTPEAGKVREPVLRFVQWARTFGATSPTNQWNIGDTTDASRRLGQSPLRAASVFNFFRPGYVPPNSALGARGLVAPELQITNESSVVGYANFMQAVIPAGVGEVRAIYTAELPFASDASALTERYAILLAGGGLSATTKASIARAVGSIAATTDAGRLNRIYAAILLVMCSPEYIVQK